MVEKGHRATEIHLDQSSIFMELGLQFSMVSFPFKFKISFLLSSITFWSLRHLVIIIFCCVDYFILVVLVEWSLSF